MKKIIFTLLVAIGAMYVSSAQNDGKKGVKATTTKETKADTAKRESIADTSKAKSKPE